MISWLVLATVLLRRRQGRCGPCVRLRRPRRWTGVGSFPVRLRGDLVSASGEFHVRQWGVSTVRAQRSLYEPRTVGRPCGYRAAGALTLTPGRAARGKRRAPTGKRVRPAGGRRAAASALRPEHPAPQSGCPGGSATPARRTQSLALAFG